MPKKLVRHGSNSGYRAEIAAGNDPCRRCHNAHLVYNSQYTRAAKAKGVKYQSGQVIDHLYQASDRGFGSGSGSGRHTPASTPSDSLGSFTVEATPGTAGSGRDEAATGRSGPSLADRIKSIVIDSPSGGNDYVEDDDIPDYLTPGSVDPDPDPDNSDYENDATNDPGDFVINAAGMAKIEDSLGTYMAIFGLTFEMIDPYCGPIFEQNLDNMVKKWSKVIAKYPKAADLFLEGKGGTIMTWLSAIQATWPFLYAIYEHHLSKSVQTQNGMIFRQTTPGTAPRTDPLQPQFNYTAS